MALALDAHAVLLTADKDFGELVFAKGLPHEGVILARLHGLDSSDKWTTRWANVGIFAS